MNKTYGGYAIHRLVYSDELKAFVNNFDICVGKGSTIKLATEICNRITNKGFKRAYSTVRYDILNCVCPSGLAEIYLDVFKDFGFNPSNKPFFDESEVVFLEVEKKEPEVIEKIIEVEKPIYVTAPGEEWDYISLFKLISQLSESDLLYLRMLVGSDTSWFYNMEAKRLLKMKLISEEDVRTERRKETKKKRSDNK